MSSVTDCADGIGMSGIWAIIVSVILFMIAFAYISSKITNRKRKKEREKVLPSVSDSVQIGCKYNIFLNDGRKFLEVEIVGTTEINNEHYPLTVFEDMLVLKQANNKRLFLKHASIRFIEEV